MDYGKTAYLRVEELEARVGKLSSPKRVNNTFACVSPGRELKDGRTAELFLLDGGGVATLTLKITATVYSPGTLRLYVGGKRSGAAEFVSAGRSGEIIVASLIIREPTRLELRPEDGFFGCIHRAEMTASGEGATILPAAGAFCADEADGTVAVLISRDDRLHIGLYSASSGELITNGVIAGCGNVCDVTRDGKNFVAVYRDGFGGVWGIKLIGGEVMKREYLFGGADGLAIASYAGGFVIAAVKGGELYTALTDSDFRGCTRPKKEEFGFSQIESAEFVKGADKPCLILNSGNKSFLKFGGDETVAYGTLTAEFGFSAEGTND